MSLTKISQLPNQDMLNNLFTYDNGKLFWKKVPVDYQLSTGMAKRECSALARNTNMVVRKQDIFSRHHQVQRQYR